MRYNAITGLTDGQLTELTARLYPEVDGLTSTGRPYALALFGSVALVVALMRKNMTQDVAAAFFGVSQPTVSRRWDLLRPLIGEVLSEFVPDPRKVIGKGTALVDGTVCPTWDWSAIPDLFSGKTGYPGMNIQIATDLDGAVAAISATAFNNQLSLIRAAVERAVAHVKTWRMLSEEGGRYRAHRQIRQHAQGNHRAILLQQGL